MAAKRRLHAAEHRAPVVAPSRRVQHVVVADVDDPLVQLVEDQPGVIAPAAASYVGRQRGRTEKGACFVESGVGGGTALSVWDVGG